MSKIIDHAEKHEDVDVICTNCIGHFQQVADNSKISLFKRKFYQNWFWLCNKCGLRSKNYCSRIKREVK